MSHHTTAATENVFNMNKLYIITLIFSGFVAASTASSQSLQNNYNKSKNLEENYESIRLRSQAEGLVLKCRKLHHNFLEGYVFNFVNGWPDKPPGSHVPKTTYEKIGDTISWIWSEGSVTSRGGVIYRTMPSKAEINLTTKTRYYEDGDKIYKDSCISISTDPEVRRREEIERNPNPGSWQDIGQGISVWKGNDGVRPLGDPVIEGDRLRNIYIEKDWDYSYGRKK